MVIIKTQYICNLAEKQQLSLVFVKFQLILNTYNFLSRELNRELYWLPSYAISQKQFYVQPSHIITLTYYSIFVHEG